MCVSLFNLLTSLFFSAKLWGRLTGDKLKALHFALHAAPHDTMRTQ